MAPSAEVAKLLLEARLLWGCAPALTELESPRPPVCLGGLATPWTVGTMATIVMPATREVADGAYLVEEKAHSDMILLTSLTAMVKQSVFGTPRVGAEARSLERLV